MTRSPSSLSGRPCILILGAMKSGTTTLFDMLAQHPEICPARIKEPGFFAFEEIWAQGLAWYNGFFDYDPARHRYLLDGSTDHAKHPFTTGVADRIAAWGGDRVKLIYIMRHPLRRIESHARYVQRTRREVGRFLSPRPDHGFDAGISPVSLAISRYASQIAQFERHWEAGDLLLLTLEELRADRDGAAARLARFLDLEMWAWDTPEGGSNVASERRKLSPIWARLAAVPGLTTFGKRLLPEGVRARIKDRFRCQVSVPGRFALTAAEEAALLEALAPDLETLRARYGIDTERHWRI